MSSEPRDRFELHPVRRVEPEPIRAREPEEVHTEVRQRERPREGGEDGFWTRAEHLRQSLFTRRDEPTGGRPQPTNKPIFPLVTHWNCSPGLQLRYYITERERNREALKVGLDIDVFAGSIITNLKYRIEDLRLGISGLPNPDVFYASLGVVGALNNRLVMSVGYSLCRREPIVYFKVKSGDRLRARVGGRSGASVDSPAGLDYNLSVPLSSTTRIKAIGSLDLPQTGVLFGAKREPIHCAINALTFKQRITNNFMMNGLRSLLDGSVDRRSGRGGDAPNPFKRF